MWFAGQGGGIADREPVLKVETCASAQGRAEVGGIARAPRTH